MSPVPTDNPLDTLPDSAPVDMGMLRATVDQIGQGVGLALAMACTQSGLDRTEQTLIAQVLRNMLTHGVFTGPSRLALGGVVYGIAMHIRGTPEEIGKPPNTDQP